MRLIVGIDVPESATDWVARWAEEFGLLPDDSFPEKVARDRLEPMERGATLRIEVGPELVDRLIELWRAVAHKVRPVAIAVLSSAHARHLQAVLSEFPACFAIEPSLAELCPTLYQLGDLERRVVGELALLVLAWCNTPWGRGEREDRPRPIRNLPSGESRDVPHETLTVRLGREQDPAELMAIVYEDVPAGDEESHGVGGRNALLLASMGHSRGLRLEGSAERTFTFLNSSAAGFRPSEPLSDGSDLVSRVRSGKIRIIGAVGGPTHGREV